MELAREPGVDPAGKSLALAGSSLRGGHRLSRRTWTEQECDSCTHPSVRLGEEPRAHLRARSHGCGQKLRRFGTGAESLPRWLCRLLLRGNGVVPRSEPGTGRWQSPATAE